MGLVGAECGDSVQTRQRSADTAAAPDRSVAGDDDAGGDGAGERTVDSHVRSLRRKLGAGFVRTVHGIGYSLGEVPG